MNRFCLLLLWSVYAFAHAESDLSFANGFGQYGVGLRVVQLVDRARVLRDKIDLLSGAPATGERARPIQTLIWYPATPNSGTPLRYDDYLRTAATELEFARTASDVTRHVARGLKDDYANLNDAQAARAAAQVMRAMRDARAAPGTFPVLIYAPGSSSSAHENADLCEYLASHGYLVLASASVGVNTRSINLDLEGAEAQAGDIAFLTGYAQTLEQADGARLAVIGYSFGGLANVLAAARDDRIGALVALDGSVRYFPAIVQSAAYATPERLALPMLYLGGKPRTAEVMNRNQQVPSSSLMNQMKYADLYNVTMDTMEHAAFQSESLRLGPEQRFGDYTLAEAALAYGWMGRYVLAFLDGYLKNDASALAFMRNRPQQNGVPAHLLSLDLHLAEGGAPTLATLAGSYARRGHSKLADIFQTMSKRDARFKPGERALISWGERFLEQTRYREALEIFALTSALYPDSPRARFYLALGYDKHHDDVLAIAAYRRVLALWPDMQDALRGIERLEGVPAQRHANFEVPAVH